MTIKTKHLTTSELAYHAAAMIRELNARSKAASDGNIAAKGNANGIVRDEPNDWATFSLLDAMASYDDAMLESFAAFCDELGVTVAGDKLDDDGEPVFENPRDMNGYHDFVGSRI
jgi:hypothetical protein